MLTKFTDTLHLFRCLLRETSYLFDSNARQYLHAYVVTTFRHNKSRFQSRPSQEQEENGHASLPQPLPRVDERAQLRRGRRFLHILERANLGHLSALEKVLMLTYGRAGRRRRDLMDRYMIQDGDDETTTTSASDQSSRDWRPPTLFDHLIRSQSTIHHHISQYKLDVRPKVPAENKMGKSMPASRVKTAHKKWYARTAAVLYPDLPEPEWHAVKDKAYTHGAHNHQRRPRARVHVFSTPDTALDLSEVSHMVRGPDKSLSTKQRRLVGNPHRTTGRFLRRTYARAVLRRTPLVRAAQDGKSVVFQWNGGPMQAKSVVSPTSEVHAQQLFG